MTGARTTPGPVPYLGSVRRATERHRHPGNERRSPPVRAEARRAVSQIVRFFAMECCSPFQVFGFG